MSELDSALDFIPIDDGQRGPQITAFTGSVLSVAAEMDEKIPGRAIIRIVFENLSDITAVSPYEFPIFDITVGVPKANKSGKANRASVYAVLLTSVQKVLPDAKSFRELEGKKLKMEWTPGHGLLKPVKDTEGNITFEEKEGNAWEVLAVVGGGNGAVAVRDVEAIALALLHGKTRQKFSVDALRNEEIRKTMATAIASGKWFKEMEDAGKAIKGEDGVYNVVPF